MRAPKTLRSAGAGFMSALANLHGLLGYPLRIRSGVGHKTKLVLGILPFILVLAGYFWISNQRHAENPKDKLAPNVEQFIEGFKSVWEPRISGYETTTVREGETAADVAKRMSGSIDFVSSIKADPPLEDIMTGENRALKTGEEVKAPVTQRRIVADTKASLTRLSVGLGIAVLLSVSIGLLAGCYSHFGATTSMIVTGLAKIPPLAILPIIFILAGAGEESKIAIIVIGVAPTMTLDIMQRVLSVPRQLIVKAYTLGATSFEIAVDVILPMVWPQVINSLRLALGPAWVFLIAAEAISSNAGLGYRIFVVQRQLGMNVILIYVVWIMLIGLAMDKTLLVLLKRAFGWSEEARQ